MGEREIRSTIYIFFHQPQRYSVQIQVPLGLIPNAHRVWWTNMSNIAFISQYRKTGRNSQRIGLISLIYQLLSSLTLPVMLADYKHRATPLSCVI